MVTRIRYKDCLFDISDVSFISSYQEAEMYTKAIVSALRWGKKIDKENKEYFSKNHLIDKYNV